MVWIKFGLKHLYFVNYKIFLNDLFIIVNIFAEKVFEICEYFEIKFLT